MSGARKRQPDPILALIAPHAKAAKADDRAEVSLGKLKDRIDARPSEKRRHFNRRLTSVQPYFDIGPKYDPVAVIKSRGQIKHHVDEFFDRVTRSLGPKAAGIMLKHKKTAVRELEAAYDAFQRDHAKRREVAGITAREDAVDVTHRDAHDALMRVLEAAPTTPGGRRALARHLAQMAKDDPPSVPWWALQAAMERLAKMI